jgi:DNA repair exonuclease SbcCD nuclease subunit
MLGDLFESASPTIKERLAFYRLMDTISSYPKCKFHIVPGNHDYEKNKYNFLHELSYLLQRGHLKWNKFLDIYYTLTHENGFTIFPWVYNRNDLVPRGNSEFLLGHKSVKGFNLSENHINKAGIDVGELESFKYCIFGHLHIPDEKKNVYYCGSPYHITFGENDKPKRVLSYENGKLKSIDMSIIAPGKHLLQFSTILLSKKKHIDIFIDILKENPCPLMKGTILRIKYDMCTIDRNLITAFMERIYGINKPYYIDIIPFGIVTKNKVLNAKIRNEDVGSFLRLYIKKFWKNKRLEKIAIKLLERVK